MRSSLLVAPLLLVALTSSASAQAADYCRIYRAMTIGTSACYYCLKCPTCSDPAGYVGGWDEPIGGCGLCAAVNCFAAAAAPVLAPGGEPAPAPPGIVPPPPATAPKAAPQRALVRAPLLDELPLTEEPDVLYDPAICPELTKWIVSIDVTDDMVDNPVKVFLVTAFVTPKKKNSNEYYEGASLGFGVQIAVDLPQYKHVTAVQVKHVGGDHYQFKIKEKYDNTVHNKKCFVHLPMQAAAP
jgi:hypothetical protein